MTSSPLDLPRACEGGVLGFYPGPPSIRRRLGATAVCSRTIERLFRFLFRDIEFRENGPHSRFQGRDLVLDDVPDDPPVDLEVSMDELVPGTGNQPPGDLRVLFFQGPRDVLRRLSDDLD